MIVHEKNAGAKIKYELIDSDLHVGDDELVLDLASMQNDDPVYFAVFFDKNRALTTNSRKGRAYVMEIVIPPTEYVPSEDNPEEITPAPIDLNKVELTLWAMA